MIFSGSGSGSGITAVKPQSEYSDAGWGDLPIGTAAAIR